MKLGLLLLTLGAADLVWINASLVPRARSATPPRPHEASVTVAAVVESGPASEPSFAESTSPAATVRLNVGARASGPPPRVRPSSRPIAAPVPTAEVEADTAEPKPDLVIEFEAPDEVEAEPEPESDVEVVIEPRVVPPLLFESGAATLSTTAAAAVERLARAMVDDPVSTVALRGHTDHRGRVRTNRRLARARAEAVAAALHEHGIDRARIEVSAARPRTMQAGAVTAASMAAERRVDVVVRRPTPKRTHPEPEDWR